MTRNLEVIGQAVKDLGTERLLASDPGVPWGPVAGARNILAHQYLGVDIRLVWNIVEQGLPRLEQRMFEIAKREGIPLGESGVVQFLLLGGCGVQCLVV